MGFRLNKTLKTNWDSDILEQNPIENYKRNKKTIGIMAGFYDLDATRTGLAVTKWKTLGLISIPVFCYMAFKILTYADPLKLEMIKKKADAHEIAEKETLEN